MSKSRNHVSAMNANDFGPTYLLTFNIYFTFIIVKTKLLDIDGVV